MFPLSLRASWFGRTHTEAEVATHGDCRSSAELLDGSPACHACSARAHPLVLRFPVREKGEARVAWHLMGAVAGRQWRVARCWPTISLGRACCGRPSRRILDRRTHHVYWNSYSIRSGWATKSWSVAMNAPTAVPSTRLSSLDSESVTRLSAAASFPAPTKRSERVTWPSPHPP